MFFLTSYLSSQVHCGLSVGTGENHVDQRLKVSWLMWVQLISDFFQFVFFLTHEGNI